MAKKKFWNLSYEKIGLTLLLIITCFLRFAQLDQKIIFIGDFAWFYLSARDMLLTGTVPLVGIASSHPWIHQGALWTYLLAPALIVGNFNPLAGGYLAVGIGVVTTGVLFHIAKELYGKHVAFFTTLFYATSPLIIMHDRMPYHTTPIPLFVLLYFYAIYRWIKGSSGFFISSFFLITVLYNFELATSVLFGPFIVIFLYGLVTKQPFVLHMLRWRIVVSAIVAFIIPLLPMIIYDFYHYFGQTIGYLAWLAYRILLLFGFPSLHPEIAHPSLSDFFQFLYKQQSQFFYAKNALFSLLIFIASMVSIYSKIRESKYLLLGLFFTIPFIALIISRVPSEAYLPMLFIQLALMVGIFFHSWMDNSLQKKIAVSTFVICFCFINMASFLTEMQKKPQSYLDKVAAAQEIIRLAGTSDFRLVPAVKNSQYESFIMPYEYLVWWMGRPTHESASVVIEVGESDTGIDITKRIK